MQESFNFSCRWFVPSDLRAGADAGDGSYNGVYGLLQRREVDYAPAGLFMRDRILLNGVAE